MLTNYVHEQQELKKRLNDVRLVYPGQRFLTEINRTGSLKPRAIWRNVLPCYYEQNPADILMSTQTRGNLIRVAGSSARILGHERATSQYQLHIDWKYSFTLCILKKKEICTFSTQEINGTQILKLC